MGVRKGNWVSRITSMRAIALASTMGILLGMPKNAWSLEFGRQIVNAEYQGCISDMLLADNGGLELTTDEYPIFVALRSGGQLQYTEYSELPLPLLATFNFGACFCALISSDDQCCVGENANITLNVEANPMIADNLATFCRSVDRTILSLLTETDAPTVAGSDAPSGTPIFAGSDAPSETPTMATSDLPSATPTISTFDAPSATPTGADSDPPSATPTVATSDVPVATDSEVPSGSPTAAVSVAPSATPTGEVLEPTLSPSNMPTVAASNAPSGTLTDVRSSVPTAALSHVPSMTPTAAPTGPTMRPTSGNELCVNFQYGIVNNAGFNASAIMNMENNTLKSGLIIATTNVTIEILNASFPEAQRFLRYRKQRTAHHLFAGNAREAAQPQQTYRLIVPLAYFGTNLPEGFVAENPDLEPEGGGRTLAYLPQQISESSSSLSQLSRRLVYYLETVPPEILSIIDNQLCSIETPEMTKCAIVTSRVCVFLEDSDDPIVVRSTLTSGLLASIESGEFEAAIPPEDRLP